MKNIKNLVVIPLLVGVLVTAFGFYLAKESPKVVFNITESIPMSITGTNSSDQVQLIEIKNIGKAEATDIHVLFGKKLNDFEVQKANISDSFETYETPNSVEIQYPSLVANDDFAITIVSSSGISLSDLEVKYNKGVADNVYKEESSFSLFAIAGLVTGCIISFLSQIYLFYLNQYINIEDNISLLIGKKQFRFVSEAKGQEIITRAIKAFFSGKTFGLNDIIADLKEVSEMRKTIKTDKGRNIYDEYAEKYILRNIDLYIKKGRYSEDIILHLLSIERPSYIGEQLWNERRKYAIEALIDKARNESTYKGINLGLAYRFLNNEVNVNLSDSERNELISELSDVMKSQYMYCHLKAYSLNVQEAIKVIQIKKPEDMNDSSWKMVEKSLYKALLQSAMSLNRLDDENELVKNISMIKELDINQDYEKKTLNVLKQIYVSLLLKQYKYEISYVKIKGSLSRDILSEDEISSIEEIFYFSSLVHLLKSNRNFIEDLNVDDIEWLSNEHATLLKKYSSKIRESIYKTATYDAYEEVIRQVLSGRFTKSEVCDNEFLDDDFLDEAENISTVIQENYENNSIIQKYKDVILSQLELINKVLDDPTEIDRVEIYENPLSEKNYQNLVKVARILLSQSNE